MKNISQKVSEKIGEITAGSIFQYSDLDLEIEEFGAAMKAVSRLVKQGKISRIKPGMFYVPQKVNSEEEILSTKEIMNTILFKEDKILGYVTGMSLFSLLGLTSENTDVIEVAYKEKRRIKRREKLNVLIVKSYAEINEKNVKLLQYLDVIKGFKRIPDRDDNLVFQFLFNKIKELNKQEKMLLVENALKYPPRIRAILGAILDELNEIEFLSKLKKSLNPVSQYKVGIESKYLTNLEDWNIK